MVNDIELLEFIEEMEETFATVKKKTKIRVDFCTICVFILPSSVNNYSNNNIRKSR